MKEKVEKKEKRYFCDFIGQLEHPAAFNFISAVIIAVLASVFIYKFYVSDSISEYSTEAAEYLSNVAEDVIIEGVGIDLLALPDDVMLGEIKRIDDDKYSFTYFFKDSKRAESMYIILSNDFYVLSKNVPSPSQVNSLRVLNSIIGGLLFVMAWICLLFISYVISTAHKAIVTKKRKNKNLS